MKAQLPIFQLTTGTPGQYLEMVINDNYPEFKSIVKEHRVSYREIIPHILFGEFVTYIEKLVIEEESLNLCIKMCKFMEELLETNDEYLVNLVCVSFIENFNPLEEPYKIVKKYFDPKLLEEAKLLEKSWGITN